MKRIRTALCLILAAALLAGCAFLPSDSEPETPAPTDPLTGLALEWQGQRPVAVAIENSTASTTQCGLSSASVVLEALTEVGTPPEICLVFPALAATPKVGPVAAGQDTKAAQLYYNKIVPCGGYLRQYTQQLLNTAITDAQGTYTTVSALSDRVKWVQTVVVALCLALGCVMAFSVLTLLTPVQQMIGASREVTRGEFDSPDLPAPRQPEMAQLTEAFNHMKHSMAEQVTTLREKNEMERELHRQKTEALELQNRMERSRLQQLRSQIDPHFLFNTLNVIQQTAGTETAYRTQALIMALSHLLRYSLMSNDEQVPLSREVRIVDEYYSIYHVRFGERVRMEWRISDSLDLTETMVPSFILQPIVENAFKHGICPKEEGGVVRIRVNPLREKHLLCIRVVDNGVGIQPEQLQQLRGALSQPGERWEHIGIYNVAARLRLLDRNSRLVIRSHPGRGTAVVLYLPLVENEEEFEE